jgi:PST family polysaccharide transporter
MAMIHASAATLRRVPFDESGAFRSVVNLEALRPVAVHGAAVTLVCQGLAFAIQLIGSITLARLLSPTDFGVVTMVTTFSLLFMNFGVNGFTEAILQREFIDHSLVSNVFWIGVGVAAVFTVGFAAAGPLLTRFYGDPRVAAVATALSITILVTAASVPHVALLKRAMSFAAVAGNEVFARGVSVVVSVCLAWMAYGYWALVAGAVAQPVATCAGAWMLCRWVPGRPRRHPGTGAMVRFAMNTYGHFTANYFTRNLDNLLVGWFFGPQSLGFYKRAYDLTILPVAQLSGPLQAVAVPTLSRLANDPDRYRRFVLRSLSTVAFLGMGIGAGFAIAGTDLFVLLFGRKWEESGRLFMFFAPGMGSMMIYLTYGYIHLSIGKSERLLRWGLVEFAVTALLFLLGIKWGPMGIAVAWMASSWILIVPALWYAGKPARLGLGSMIEAIWRYIVAAAIAGRLSVVIIRAIPSLAGADDWMGALVRSVVTMASFAVLYLASVVVLHRGFQPIREVLSLVGDAMPAWTSNDSETTEPVKLSAAATVSRG